MSSRIKIVSSTADQFIQDEKVSPSLTKEVKMKVAPDLWSIKILYPKKDEETGQGTFDVLKEIEYKGDINGAMDTANALLEEFKDVEVEYFEVKHIPHYKKGKFKLKLKKTNEEAKEELSDKKEESSKPDKPIVKKKVAKKNVAKKKVAKKKVAKKKVAKKKVAKKKVAKKKVAKKKVTKKKVTKKKVTKKKVTKKKVTKKKVTKKTSKKVTSKRSSGVKKSRRTKKK